MNSITTTSPLVLPLALFLLLLLPLNAYSTTHCDFNKKLIKELDKKKDKDKSYKTVSSNLANSNLDSLDPINHQPQHNETPISSLYQTTSQPTWTIMASSGSSSSSSSSTSHTSTPCPTAEDRLERTRESYIVINFDYLQEESSQGQGEHLEVLADLLVCERYAHPALFDFIKNNHSQIFAPINRLNPTAFVSVIKTKLNQNPQLKNLCFHKIDKDKGVAIDKNTLVTKFSHSFLRQNFVDENYELLEVETQTISGDKTKVLTVLMGCSASLSDPLLSLIRKNKILIFNQATKDDSTQFIKAIQNLIKHSSFAGQCKADIAE